MLRSTLSSNISKFKLLMQLKQGTGTTTDTSLRWKSYDVTIKLLNLNAISTSEF